MQMRGFSFLSLLVFPPAKIGDGGRRSTCVLGGRPAAEMSLLVN